MMLWIIPPDTTITSFLYLSSLRHYILTTIFPPPTTPHSFPLRFFSPSTTPPPFSLLERADLQQSTVKGDKTRYNKKRHKPFYGCWTWQANRKKIVKGRQKRQRDTPVPTVKNYTKTLTSQNIYTKDLVQTHTDSELASTVSVSQCEP